jgi:hypothetical protein
MYRRVDLEGRLPDPAVETRAIDSIAHGVGTRSALVAFYSGIERRVRGLDREEALKVLAEMEIGDRTEPEKANRQDEVDASLARVVNIAKAEAVDCEDPDDPTADPGTDPGTGPGTTPDIGLVDSVPLFEAWRKTYPAALYGAYKTFSVGYQSCTAISGKPMTSSSPSISGVSIVGTHSDGVGKQRLVSDAAAVFATNPFYSARVSPLTACFTATSTPIIYDYGGKPYASSTVGAELDLTRNAGSGTSALGIDCSGFVGAAILSGGLRLKVGVSSKPYQVSGVGAASYADPQANGLTCFNRLKSTATQTLRPGDIVSHPGHVWMVASVGPDPLGINGATTAAQCDAVTSSKFDFTIIQSSSGKGGIGMNRIRAADWLATSSAFRDGMVAYAKSFCRVRLGLTPETTLANKSLAVVVRHSGTDSCKDRRITLAGESCLKSCPSSTLLLAESP